MKKSYFLLALAIFSQIAFGQTTKATSDDEYYGALVPNCAVDTVREKNGKFADKAVESSGDIISDVGAEKPSEQSCFDQLKKIASYINFSIPSSIFNEGIIDKIKDKACSAALSAAKRAINRNRIAVDSPYGMYGVEVGASTSGESGVSVDKSGPALEEIEKLIINNTGKVINNAGKKATEQLDESTNVDDINRAASKKRREGESAVEDEADDVSEGLNAI